MGAKLQCFSIARRDNGKEGRLFSFQVGPLSGLIDDRGFAPPFAVGDFELELEDFQISRAFLAFFFFFSIIYWPFSGMYFWDYGNAFLLEARRAGADVGAKKKMTPAGTENGEGNVGDPGAKRNEGNDGEPESIAFRYPSYVQDIMG